MPSLIITLVLFFSSGFLWAAPDPTEDEASDLEPQKSGERDSGPLSGLFRTATAPHIDPDRTPGKPPAPPLETLPPEVIDIINDIARKDPSLDPWLPDINRARKKTDPDNPEVYSQSAQDAFNQKNYAQAYKDAQDAIARGARDAQTHTLLAAAALNSGDPKTAVAHAQKALSLDPNNANALKVLNAAQGTGRPVTDVGSFTPKEAPAAPAAPSENQTLTEDPSGFAAALGAGAGAPDITARQAAPRSDSALADTVRSAELTQEAAMALGVKNYSSAHSMTTNAIGLNPNNAQAYNYRAIANNKLRRFNDAASDASASLKLAPGNSPALLSRSWALNKQKKYKEGLADADAILQDEPNNPYAYQNRAFSLAGLGETEEMRASLKRSAELEPRFKPRYEQALQLPNSADALFLFDDAPGVAAAAPSPSQDSRKKRFLMRLVAALSGGILAALLLLQWLSSRFREKVGNTLRRSAAAPAAETGLQFELIREVGAGGMGVVYEARDLSLDRTIAIKKMRDEIRGDPQERARFITEAKTVAALHHPNIVDIYSIVEDGPELYLVFEYVSGKTLSAQLRESGPLDFAAARRIIKCACDAVDYSHRNKIIHRDIKPSNIMVTEGGYAKVMDFGVARQAKEALTKKALTNTIVGTSVYMAPEQEQGAVRFESDVYALGIVLYEMLAGQLPFQGQGAGMLLNKINGVYTPISQAVKKEIPDGLDGLFAKAFAADPNKRYRTPAEFLSAVEALGYQELV